MNKVSELTPDLADKIFDSIKMKMLGDKLSKEGTLHQLKQLKAHIGKIKKKVGYQNDNTQSAITECMEMIDKKIQKVTNN